MLVQEYADIFMQNCRDDNNSAGELNQKRLALNNHLLPFFGQIDFNSINAATIRRYQKQKLSEEYAPKTINNHLLILSRMIRMVRDDGHLSVPSFRMKMLAIEQTEARYLQAHESQQLLAVAKAEPDPRWHAMLTFALHTGLRIGELLALEWSQINLEPSSPVMTVDKSFCRVSNRAKKTKNGRKRHVSLNKVAYAALMTRSHRDGTVWGVDYADAYAAINRIADCAGLDHVGWHTLRHTFASNLVLEGVSLFAVSRLLGHASITMTERYAHLNMDKNREATDTLALAS